MFGRKKEEVQKDILENWELYPSLIKAKEEVDNFKGAKTIVKVTKSKQKDGTIVETEEVIENPEYTALINNRNALMEQADAYRQRYNEELEATKQEPMKAKVVPSLITGGMGLVGVVLSIFGKSWLEKNDKYDEGGVLNDTQKQYLRPDRKR